MTSNNKHMTHRAIYKTRSKVNERQQQQQNTQRRDTQSDLQERVHETETNFDNVCQ